MKKVSWNKILNISLIVIATLVLGLFLVIPYFKPPKTNVDADQLITGVPFRVGVMNRTGSMDANKEFNYQTEDFFNGTFIDKPVEVGNYVMLENYAEYKGLYNGTEINSSTIQNLYISFGKELTTPYNESDEFFITNLRVFVKLNGESITVNEVTEYNAAGLLPSNIDNAYYWYDYFDARNFGEGLYEFTFDYMYSDKEGNISQGQTYSYSFYLLDQCSYDVYPEITTATRSPIADSEKVVQYYYNYTAQNLPSIYFDASRYNLSYTRQKDNLTEIVTSSFTINQSNEGVLTLNRNVNGNESTQTITTTYDDIKKGYFLNIYFDELGVYDFTVKYLIQVESGANPKFNIIENIAAYEINSADNSITTDDSDTENYENGNLAKAKIKLHLFGVKAYFTKYGGSELKQINTNVPTSISQADVTHYLYSDALTNPYGNVNIGFGQTLLSSPNNNPVKDGTYPKTNMAPVYFEYYATFKFNGNIPTSQYNVYSNNLFTIQTEAGYVTKDTHLNSTGYYEVVINYTYDLYTSNNHNNVAAGGQYVHSQAFVFEINNSTPTVTMFKGLEQNSDTEIKNNSYVNTGVSAYWTDPTYYEADFVAKYSQYDFNNNLLVENATFEKQKIIGNATDGVYYLRLYFTENEDVYVEYSFIIDTQAIANIQIQPIYARISTEDYTTVTGYGLVTDKNQVDFGNRKTINQPFTLTYSEKASGAQIKTKYYKIPFGSNLNVGNKVNLSSSLVVENDYVIDPTNMSSGDYILNYSSIKAGLVASDNTFVEDRSYVYYFEIEDAAGNKATHYIIYDLTKPYVIVDANADTDEIDIINNPYGIVTSKASLTWGNYKGLKIDSTLVDDKVTNDKLQAIIDKESTLFHIINGSYYLCVPISNVKVTYIDDKITATTRTATTNVSSPSVTIYPTVDPNDPVRNFFGGDDKTYRYYVTDASHVTSATNLAKSNIRNNFIRMFLDNAQGIAYGYFGSNPSSSQFDGYENITAGTSSAKQLRFTYLEGEKDSGYYVEAITYTYYDFANEEYSTIDPNYIAAYNSSIASGIPYPSYPFSKNATITNRSLAKSSLAVAGQPNRVVTEIINPISENGVMVTKPGMYVIKRQYQEVAGKDYSLDGVTRYYLYYVDRTGIIEIDSTVADENIYQTTRSEMLYETGSGILFNFYKTNNDGNYETYYTALQIQQYLSYITGAVFDSNKLPINFNLPLDKYNSKLTLYQATDNSSSAAYITSLGNTNAYNFGLRYKISFVSGQNATIVFDNTGLEVIQNNSYVSITENASGYRTLELIKDGQYSISLYDTSDSRSSQLNDETASDITKQFNNTFGFSFKISHESPKGQYYSNYNDNNRSEMLLISKDESTSNIDFTSFNKDALRFKFSKTDNKYRAEIDPTKVLVQKRIGNGNLVSIYNSGTTNNPEVLQYVPDENNANAGTYILTVFDEYEYLNNNKTYIGGSGETRDYLLSKVQNIEYVITLQYYGNENDYIVTANDGTQTNFYTRTFTIVLDRIKPQYNYSNLVDLDNQKFNASETLPVEQFDNYFFAVGDTYQFTQQSELDSQSLFVRSLGQIYPTYYKTYTPDDENYYESGNTDHIRFSESNSSFSKRNYSDGIIEATNLFTSGAGYYEIVERDEAGNYNVYAIFYRPTAESNIITYNYEPTDPTKNGINQVVEYDTQVLGNNLQFVNIENSVNTDYFYKCIITYGGTSTTITNNPNNLQNINNWNGFLNAINAELEFTKVINDAGYKVILEFVNRVGDNYVVTFLVPGDRLEPTFVDLSETEFKITLPSATESTYVVEFHAYKFTGGVWIEQSQDSYGNTIIKASNNISLSDRSYVFADGEYKFQLIDNFGRGGNEGEYFYKGVGVNDVREIFYGPNVDIDNIIYTAQTVTLNYQINLYTLQIFVPEEDDALDESLYADYGITKDIPNNDIQTIIFRNSENNTAKQFIVKLTIEKASATYTYNFIINKTLPEIQLMNLSGGYLEVSKDKNNPTVHNENFYVIWEASRFNEQVTLHRSYLDELGLQRNETILNIPNGYEVSLPGTYKATITNALNYTDSSYDIYFKLVDGEVVVFSVIAIDNGLDRVLRPSPVTSLYQYSNPQNGLIENKVLYNYYILSEYNQEQGSDKFIEIRPEKDKGINYSLLETTSSQNALGQIDSRIYRIFGTSNYGYERFIRVIFVDEVIDTGSSVTLTNITAFPPTTEEGIEAIPFILTNGDIKTSVESITLSWDAYNDGAYANPELKGNLIYLDYYFNGNKIRTISSTTQARNTITITNAGIYKFVLRDLAGNVQRFGSKNELVINLVNNVLFTVNNNEPINNQVFNGEVILEITNRYLYYDDPSITATLNGESINPERVGTSFYQYRFTTHGYYEVTLQTRISQDEHISTTYCFTIINSKVALPCFSMPQNSNFKVVRVIKQNADITYELESLNELWISPATLGIGNYTITLSQFNDALNTDVEFEFSIWINNEVPYIFSSIEFGKSTTKSITITYNPKIIYDQIGESYIAFTNESPVYITEESVNEIQTRVLSKNQDYWIQIYSADHKLINSYKVTKDEPLNTTAIIIIVVASVVVVALIVVFIIMRRHMKFR